MFFLNTSDALDVYLDGLVINLSSLFTSKSAMNALWIEDGGVGINKEAIQF